jgi:hypothetical protein
LLSERRRKQTRDEIMLEIAAKATSDLENCS